MSAPHSGYTRIELVVVLIILAILAASIVPRLANQPLTLAASAEQFAGDIRYVQSLAMTQGQRYRIIVNAGSYSFADNTGAAVANPTTGTTAAIPLAGITITSAPALPASPNNFIAFDDKGIPYDSTATALAADEVFTLTATGGVVTGRVTISRQTGRVTVSVP
ncbi:MAG: pilus assembly FimT family protein [Burkholderiales bacterium]